MMMCIIFVICFASPGQSVCLQARSRCSWFLWTLDFFCRVLFLSYHYQTSFRESPGWWTERQPAGGWSAIRQSAGRTCICIENIFLGVVSKVKRSQNDDVTCTVACNRKDLEPVARGKKKGWREEVVKNTSFYQTTTTSTMTLFIGTR